MTIINLNLNTYSLVFKYFYCLTTATCINSPIAEILKFSSFVLSNCCSSGASIFQLLKLSPKLWFSLPMFLHPSVILIYHLMYQFDKAFGYHFEVWCYILLDVLLRHFMVMNHLKKVINELFILIHTVFNCCGEVNAAGFISQKANLPPNKLRHSIFSY